jgi:uncharacterized protein
MFLAKRKTQQVSWLLAYILLLFTSAIVRDFVIAPYVSHHMSGIEAVLIEPIWKLLFWIVPTFLYIRFVERQNPFTYLKLTTNLLKGLLWGLAGMAFLVAAEFPLILGHTPNFQFGTDTLINVILLVGFMEEIPFRGFLFQKLQEWLGFFGAMLLSSLLFALIHVPLWVSTGSFTVSQVLNFVMVFIVGLLACYTLKRSGSLWSSILLHTFYNILANIF